MCVLAVFLGAVLPAGGREKAAHERGGFRTSRQGGARRVCGDAARCRHMRRCESLTALGLTHLDPPIHCPQQLHVRYGIWSRLFGILVRRCLSAFFVTLFSYFVSIIFMSYIILLSYLCHTLGTDRPSADVIDASDAIAC